MNNIEFHRTRVLTSASSCVSDFASRAALAVHNIGAGGTNNMCYTCETYREAMPAQRRIAQRQARAFRAMGGR